jgi:mono/diheme cytochrome c family protein
MTIAASQAFVRVAERSIPTEWSQDGRYILFTQQGVGRPRMVVAGSRTRTAQGVNGMDRVWRAAAGCAMLVALGAASSVGAAAQYSGWLIPPGGKDEKSPMASVAGAAAKGRAVFLAHCVRCHGAEGKGDGPDAELAADLTDEYRIELNTEGVLFYKVWNGHSVQLRNEIFNMPAFAGKLSKDDVWNVVEYLKVLRTPRP